MFKRSLFVLTPIALALAVSACGDDGHQRIETVTTGPAAQATGDTFLLEGTQIRSFNRSTIGASTTEVSNQTITGLAANEVILGVDVRPATGELIALSNTGAIYSLDGTNGRLTLKSTLNASAVNTCTPAVAAFSGLSGTEFGVDVNSAVTGGLDRLRIVSDTGQNLRVDMDNGAVTVDCPISNGTATAAVPTAIAYTNAFGAANTTKLYYIDSTSNQLLVNNGTPNNGAVSVVAP